MEESISKPIPVDHGALAAALIPFLGMILMYLALAMGRRLSKLGSHTALRVVFGLALAAGLLYWPSASIAGALKYEEYLREEQPRYQREFGEPFPFEYTFSKNYFCRSADMFYDADGEFLAYCNVNLSMNMISFTAAGLVIVELATAHSLVESDPFFSMKTAQSLDRNLQLYRSFLVLVSMVLLGFEIWEIEFIRTSRQEMEEHSANIRLPNNIYVALLPFFGMISI
ncbi:hypothetical protein BG005_003191 [Podila minutissima]|nr:hypothetical protein BG005_003191 [Podila minutissima]